MPKTKAKSLDEFAAVTPARKPAWITLLPEFAEIKSAYSRGIGPRVIYEWLKSEKGYTTEQLGTYSRFRSALKDNGR